MIKKHLPTLEELFLNLKKRIQDHNVLRFHRIQELQETLNKIIFITKEYGYMLTDPDLDQDLVIDAQSIIEAFNKE